jgi:hypothetical protein
MTMQNLYEEKVTSRENLSRQRFSGDPTLFVDTFVYFDSYTLAPVAHGRMYFTTAGVLLCDA